LHDDDGDKTTTSETVCLIPNCS